MAEANRKAFEAWIAQAPFEKSVKRFPDDPSKYAWPGSYVDVAVDLAWQAWKTASRKKVRLVGRT